MSGLTRNDSEDGLAPRVCAARQSYVIAAAGCGKTYQIVEALKHGSGRRLVLTHTHAGVDVLRLRLDLAHVPKERFRIETIAAWCLRYAASFPGRSGLAVTKPKDDEWPQVYRATTRLLESGAVDGVLAASFVGLLVDEYQDCSKEQHDVVLSLATRLPTCLFGDPLQAIFDFKQQPVNWEKDVFPKFSALPELTTPWRWKNKNNEPLADWLRSIRTMVQAGGDIDLRGRPACVAWRELPVNKSFQTSAIIKACKESLDQLAEGESLIVIGDRISVGSRAKLAQGLSKLKFSNIEPINCTTLFSAAKRLDKKPGFARLEALMHFISDCLTGCSPKDFLRAVKASQQGGKLGIAKFGEPLIRAGRQVAEDGSDESMLLLMAMFRDFDAVNCYRRELFHAMRSALRLRQSGGGVKRLEDAAWEAQNRLRHCGRILSRKSVGSSLLVKGLEFDHAVVIHSGSMGRKDWYVAFTRPAKTLTIVAPSEVLVVP